MLCHLGRQGWLLQRKNMLLDGRRPSLDFCTGALITVLHADLVSLQHGYTMQAAHVKHHPGASCVMLRLFAFWRIISSAACTHCQSRRQTWWGCQRCSSRFRGSCC